MKRRIKILRIPTSRPEKVVMPKGPFKYYVWNVINLVLLLTSALAIPQNIHRPDVKDFSFPEEVNALQNNQKVQRSISDHVEGENNEETIKEVEDLIKSNPELPRLTRGEILDILDNITRQDQRNLIETINKDTDRNPKALMVVKAYTPLGSGEINVEEFYTKPPITSIIDNEETEQRVEHQVFSSTTTSSVPHFRRKTTKSPDNKKTTNMESKKPYRGNSQFKTTTLLNTTPRIRSTTTKESTTTKLPLTTRKEIKRRRRPPVTTTTVMPVTTYRPRGRLPPRKEIKYSNHKYPDVQAASPTTYSSTGIRVVEPPKIVPSQINYDLEDLLPQEDDNQETFMPMPGEQSKKEYANDKDNSIFEPSIELEIPEHLKKVVADLNLAAIKNPDLVSVTSIVPPSEKDEGEKIKDILASLGVLPPKTSSTSTAVPDANVVADSLSPDMQELLKSFGLLPYSSNEHQEKNEVASFNPEKAEIHPESYVGFKPLPEDNHGRKEMEDLLEQFGLLNKNNRKSKSFQKGNAYSESEPHKDIQVEQINLDAVPEDLQPLLHEMGFGQARVERKVRAQPVHKTIEKSTENAKNTAEKTVGTTEKQHVFNPADREHVSEEEIKKLGRLLEIMKKLEALNGTITEDDLKHIDQQELGDLIGSLKQPQSENLVTLDNQDAPNPLEYDFGLSKNEVKRQETVSTTSEPIETVTAVTIAEESKTPSIKDLEDSFGGSAETVTEALPETTTARRSGFYYLLDWNTFFEIDDQKGKRVNLRFQPKVGDPKQFYSVNVP